MGYLLPALTQKTITEQIEIIHNEINMNRDERVEMCATILQPASFQPTIPIMKSLRHPRGLGSITLDDVQVLQNYYVPSNAAVVIAGDTPSEALEKVTVFGGLQTGPRPGRVTAWIPNSAMTSAAHFRYVPPQLFLNCDAGFGTDRRCSSGWRGRS